MCAPLLLCGHRAQKRSYVASPDGLRSTNLDNDVRLVPPRAGGRIARDGTLRKSTHTQVSLWATTPAKAALRLYYRVHVTRREKMIASGTGCQGSDRVMAFPQRADVLRWVVVETRCKQASKTGITHGTVWRVSDCKRRIHHNLLLRAIRAEGRLPGTHRDAADVRGKSARQMCPSAPHFIRC